MLFLCIFEEMKIVIPTTNAGFIIYLTKEGTGCNPDESKEFYLKSFTSGNSLYERFLELEILLNGNDVFKYTKFYAIYNENLKNTFLIYRQTLSSRHKHDPKIFANENWKSRENIGLRQWSFNTFNNFIQLFPWNQQSQNELPVVPGAHGTDQSIALKICRTGFASLSILDEGFYGRGIYFTTFIPYIFPYVSSAKNPALLISLLLPGNVYPVIDLKSHKGKPLQSGYQSHYVVTRRNGHPVENENENEFYDEIVVVQESQIVPIFLVLLDRSNFPALSTNWQREVPTNELAEEDHFKKKDGVNEEESSSSDTVYIKV